MGLCDAVNDVYWAPNNSTSFAAAMDDGRVELWDLSKKPLDPIVVHYPGQEEGKGRRKRTCVRFSPNSPVLIAGDDQGSVDVMRMYNTDVQYYSDQEQQDRLLAVMAKKDDFQGLSFSGISNLLQPGIVAESQLVCMHRQDCY